MFHFLHLSACISDFGNDILRFNNTGMLLSIKYDWRLRSMVSSTSCWAVVAKTDSSEEVSYLIDFVSSFNVKKKYLLIQISFELNSNLLKKKRINFNVIISRSTSGV